LKGHFVGMPDDEELTTDKVQNGLITWFWWLPGSDGYLVLVQHACRVRASVWRWWLRAACSPGPPPLCPKRTLR
jgi:hypothetical protein